MIEKKEIIVTVLSPQAEFLYASTDHQIYCVSVKTGEVVSDISVSDGEVIGLKHHPFANIMAVYSDTAKIFILQ